MAKKNSATDKSSKSSKTDQHVFQAEVSRLLHLMVHSVYSNKEIFLRELISNGADACDKLRYDALTKPDLIKQDPDLKLVITLDKAQRRVSVSDNGIGMNEADLIDNLGTIARSGTKAFLDGLENDADVSQIGQFGVGFYSAFMVAERVDVISHKAGEGKAWHWSSDGLGEFSVAQAAKSASSDRPRGSAVMLHLKADEAEFLEAARIEQIVRAYSDHIALPIELVEVSDGKPGEARQINSARALWTRPKSEVTEDQYKEFYGHIGGVFGTPAHIIHYKAEGRHEYTVLLFVPGEQPFDLFDPERRGRSRLYVKRVLITDDAVVLPPYLRFMRGVVDSEDMPLNISREMLQDNPIVEAIKKAVTNRTLGELEKLAENDPEKYTGVWSNFGAVLKEGLYEDLERRDQLLGLARFSTTTSPSDQRSLKDYVADMKPEQSAIYYIAGEDGEQLAQSPHLEGFGARGIEVLLLSDPVDSFWTTSVLGFDGKPFRSVTQGATDLGAIDPDKADGDTDPSEDLSDAALATLIAAVKQTLSDKVEDVRRSDRLTDSAVCLVGVEGGMDKGLEQILSRGKGDGVTASPRVLEINPNHGLIRNLGDLAKRQGADGDLQDAAWLLYDLARILDGDPVTAQQSFAERLTRVMEKALKA